MIFFYKKRKHKKCELVSRPDPGGQPCVVYVGDVVALGSLCPVVVDDGKQLVAPLLGRVLTLGGRTQDFRPDLQVD